MLCKGFCSGILVGTWIVLSAAQPATAADLGSDPRLAGTEQWTVSVTPYGWMPFLKGDVTVKGRTVGLDITPFDVLDGLEAMPWMSYAEARKGRLAFYNDIFYAKLGAASSGSRFLGAAVLDASLGVDFQQTVIEVGAAYEIAKWRSPSGGSIKDPNTSMRYTAIDLVAGARYWHQELDVNLAVTGALNLGGLVVSGSRATARSGGVDWVDPLIGMRVRHQLAPGQELVLRGDVGGFDIGSNFSWNLLGAYSWDIAVRNGVSYSGLLGYRALSVDYEKGSGVNKYAYDVVQHGPIMGLTLKY